MRILPETALLQSQSPCSIAVLLPESAIIPYEVAEGLHSYFFSLEDIIRSIPHEEGIIAIDVRRNHILSDALKGQKKKFNPKMTLKVCEACRKSWSLIICSFQIVFVGEDALDYANRMSQTQQLQAILDTYTYSTSTFVPTKTLTVRKIHSYNDLWKLAKPNFWIFLFIIFFFFFS